MWECVCLCVCLCVCNWGRDGERQSYASFVQMLCDCAAMIMYNSRACAKAVHQTGLLKGENCFRKKFCFFFYRRGIISYKNIFIKIAWGKREVAIFCLLSFILKDSFPSSDVLVLLPVWPPLIVSTCCWLLWPGSHSVSAIVLAVYTLYMHLCTSLSSLHLPCFPRLFCVVSCQKHCCSVQVMWYCR